MIERVVTEVDRSVRMHISRTVGREDPQADHYAIVAACRKRDEAGALRRLERHISETQKALKAAAAISRTSRSSR